MSTFRTTVFVLLLGTVASLSEEMERIDLKNHQTTTPDGFRIKVDVGSQHFTSQRGVPFDLFWFSLAVPRKIGDTDFCRCQLMVQDGRDRTLLSVPLSVRDGAPKTKSAMVDVMIEQRYARGYKVHFQYSARPYGYIVKEYVFPIDEHLPAK
jgi:hypothetical protein